MNKNDFLKEALKKLSLSDEDIKNVLEAEAETDLNLEVPELIIYQKSDYETLLNNIKNEEYGKGKDKGTEMLIKDIREAEGLEFEGKTKDNLINALKTKVLKDAKIEPDSKVIEMQNKLNELQNNYTTLEAQKQEEINRLRNDMFQKTNVQLISSNIPDKLKEGWNKEDLTTLFVNTHEIKEDGIYKNGELLKDKLQNNISLTDAVKEFVINKGVVVKEGRGAGDGLGDGLTTKVRTATEWEQYAAKKGISPSNHEELKKVMADDFDFES